MLHHSFKVLPLEEVLSLERSVPSLTEGPSDKGQEHQENVAEKQGDGHINMLPLKWEQKWW